MPSNLHCEGCSVDKICGGYEHYQLETVVAERAALATELYAVKARLAKAITLLTRAHAACCLSSRMIAQDVVEFLREG